LLEYRYMTSLSLIWSRSRLTQKKHECQD
jgi:hypothetical protein